MSEAQGADELTRLLTRPRPRPGADTDVSWHLTTRHWGTDSHVILGSRLSRTEFMEAGEAPVRGQAGYCGCWSLVPSAQGWSPEWRPAGGPGDMLVRLRQSSGGAPELGKTRATQNPPANHRACAPTPSETAKGALSRPSPPQALTPGRPTSQRVSSCPLHLPCPLLLLRRRSLGFPAFWAWVPPSSPAAD